MYDFSSLIDPSYSCGRIQIQKKHTSDAQEFIAFSALRSYGGCSPLGAILVDCSEAES